MRVTGIVRGPAGPAEGVQVLLELSDMRIRRQVAWLQARTDTEGFFEIDLSSHDMPNYGLEFNTVSIRFMEARRIVIHKREEFPVHIELEVQPGTVARGIVTDDQGKPLEGVTILAPGVRTQTSGENGEWESFGLYPGGASLLFRKEGYSEQNLSVQSSGPEVLEGFEVVMPVATQFEATVVDPVGNAVEYPLVYFRTGDRYLMETGDDRGRVLFRGVPEVLDEVSLTAMAEGFLPTDKELNRTEKDDFAATVEMRYGVFIGGASHLPTGEPAPGAIVVAGDVFNRSAPQAVADADGKWRLGPFEPGGDIVLTVLPPSPEATWGIADLVFKSAGGDRYEGVVEMWPKGFSSDFTASFDGANVAMRRVDAGTGGFSGPVKYVAQWDGAANRIEGTLEVVGFEQTGTFTMERRYASGGGLAGEWEVREEVGASNLNVAPQHLGLKATMLPVTMHLDMNLTGGLSLAGTVTRADGTPFIDGTVHLSDWEGSDVYRPVADIRAGGRFRFDRLPEGTFQLFAVSADGAHVATPRILRGGIDGVTLTEGDPDQDSLDE